MARRQRSSVVKTGAPSLGPIVLHKATVADADAVMRSFNEVFRSNRTAAYWLWKFHRHGKLTAMLAVDAAGTVLAQHAVVPVNYWTPSTGDIAGAVRGDVFALRRTDVVATRVYVKLLRRFVSPDEGFRPDYAFVIGTPNEVNYGVLARILDLRYDFKLQKYVRRLSWIDRLRGSAETAALGAADINALWQRIRMSYSFSVAKDWDWYRWRFLDNPLHSYGIVAVRWPSGELRGWAALTRENRTAVLVELTLDPSDREGFVALERRIAAYGRSIGCRVAIGVLPEWFTRSLGLSRLGWQNLIEEVQQPLIIHDHETVPFELGVRPWYSFGDTDMS